MANGRGHDGVEGIEEAIQEDMNDTAPTFVTRESTFAPYSPHAIHQLTGGCQDQRRPSSKEKITRSLPMWEWMKANPISDNRSRGCSDITVTVSFLKKGVAAAAVGLNVCHSITSHSSSPLLSQMHSASKFSFFFSTLRVMRVKNFLYLFRVHPMKETSLALTHKDDTFLVHSFSNRV